MLSWVEHEKSCITSGPGLILHMYHGGESHDFSGRLPVERSPEIVESD